jgi:hypothetical protein
MRARPALLAAATASAAFTLALVAYSVWPEKEGGPVAWSDLSAEVGPLTMTRETKRVFREPQPFGAHLRGAGGTVPAVDFERRQVLLISPGPRSSTGYAVEVVEVSERGSTLTVALREQAPRVADRVEPRVTFPYRLISLPAGKDVYVEWRGR